MVYTHVVNRAKIRVIQRSSGSGLAIKPLHDRIVVSARKGWHFQRDLSVKIGIVRQVHRAHSTRAKRLLDPITTKFGRDLPSGLLVFGNACFDFLRIHRVTGLFERFEDFRIGIRQFLRGFVRVDHVNR